MHFDSTQFRPVAIISTVIFSTLLISNSAFAQWGCNLVLSAEHKIAVYQAVVHAKSQHYFEEEALSPAAEVAIMSAIESPLYVSSSADLTYAIKTLRENEVPSKIAAGIVLSHTNAQLTTHEREIVWKLREVLKNSVSLEHSEMNDHALWALYELLKSYDFVVSSHGYKQAHEILEQYDFDYDQARQIIEAAIVPEPHLSYESIQKLQDALVTSDIHLRFTHGLEAILSYAIDLKGHYTGLSAPELLLIAQKMELMGFDHTDIYAIEGFLKTHELD